MRIQGTYTHEHDAALPFKPKPAKASVIINNDRIESVLIEGRPYLDLEDYKNLKTYSDRSFQIRHIKSVELIKKKTNSHFLGQNVPFGISIEKANNIAKTIFNQFKKDCLDLHNLFEGKADENEGAGFLMKELEPIVMRGKESFTEWHGVFDPRVEVEAKVISFLNQTSELQQLIMKVDGGYTWLRLDYWSELCFVYENTLIDYKVLKVDLNKISFAKILDGQQTIDHLYKKIGFDSIIRDRLNDKVKRILKRRQDDLSQFLVTKEKRQRRSAPDI